VALEDGSLGVGRCACPGFSHDPKEAMDVGVTDVRIPSLRLAD